MSYSRIPGQGMIKRNPYSRPSFGLPTGCVTSDKILPSLSLGFLLYKIRTSISLPVTTQ